MSKRRDYRKGKERSENTERFPKGSEAPSTDRVDNGKGSNDVSWYARYPSLLAAAASFPYPYRPGMVVPLGAYNSTTVKSDLNYHVPGVLSLQWGPSIGISSKSTDPASVLGKEMYARVRKAYSGTLRADAPDYVIYILALDSIFSYIGWMKRLYRVLNTWTSENYLVPDGILHGMGLDDLDIRELRLRRVELWQAINTLVLQSRKFTCPGTIDYINRHYWMNDNVYADSPEVASQYYMFNQVYYYMYQLAAYEENATPVGGVTMQAMPWLRTATTPEAFKRVSVESLLTIGMGMIEAMNEWDDAYTINGYLQRAYGDGPLFILDEIPLDARFEPVYSPEVLMQIENSTPVIGGFDAATNADVNLDIYQDPISNSIISKMKLHVPTSGLPFNQKGFSGTSPFFSMRMANPGALENTIASRLKVYATVDADDPASNGYTITVHTCASELPLSWCFIGAGDKPYDGTVPMQEVMSADCIPAYFCVANGLSAAQAKPLVSKLLAMEAFDWHPIVPIAYINPTDATQNDLVMLGDIHNPTVITQEQLQNLHRVCLYSEFNSFSMD